MLKEFDMNDEETGNNVSFPTCVISTTGSEKVEAGHENTETIAPIPLLQTNRNTTQEKEFEELSQRLGSDCVDIFLRVFLR